MTLDGFFAIVALAALPLGFWAVVLARRAKRGR